MADEARPPAKKESNWGVFFLKVFLILLLVYMILVPGVNIIYKWGETGGFHLRAKDFSPFTTWKNVQSSLKSVGEEIKSVSEDEAEAVTEETEDESVAPPPDESETPQPEETAPLPSSKKEEGTCNKDDDCTGDNYCENKQCKPYCGEAASCPDGEKCDNDTNRCVSASWMSGSWIWMLICGILVILAAIFGFKKFRNKGTPPAPPPAAPGASGAVSGVPGTP